MLQETQITEEHQSILGSDRILQVFHPGLHQKPCILTPSISPKVPKTVQWTPQMEEAFDSLKSSLCTHIVLTVPNICDKFQIQTDASFLNVIRKTTGGIILQTAEGSRK